MEGAVDGGEAAIAFVETGKEILAARGAAALGEEAEDGLTRAGEAVGFLAEAFGQFGEAGAAMGMGVELHKLSQEKRWQSRGRRPGRRREA